MTTRQDVPSLLKKIAELEQELHDREHDLQVFRSELSSANKRLESLISVIKDEIQVALHLQRQLVPTEFPNIPGFEFSTKFIPGNLSGGDYFDIFEHEDRFRFGILVASSSGYGMSALLLSVFLRLTGQMEARRGKEAHEILEQITTDVMSQMKEADRAQLFYAIIDRRRYEVHYAGAGTILAFMQSAATGKLTRLKSHDKSLTPDLDASVIQSEILGLNPRDRLILCSPGVVDAENADGERFGFEALSQALLGTHHAEVHEVRNEILFKVQSHIGGAPPDRDLTVIVMEVKDRVIKLASPVESQ